MKFVVALLISCIANLSFASDIKKFECTHFDLQSQVHVLGANYHVTVFGNEAKLFVTYVIPNAQPQLVVTMDKYSVNALSDIFLSSSSNEEYEFVNIGNTSTLTLRSSVGLSSFKCELM